MAPMPAAIHETTLLDKLYGNAAFHDHQGTENELLHTPPGHTYIFLALVLALAVAVLLALIITFVRLHLVPHLSRRRRPNRFSWAASLPDMSCTWQEHQQQQQQQQQEVVKRGSVGSRARESINAWMEGLGETNDVRAPLLPRDGGAARILDEAELFVELSAVQATAITEIHCEVRLPQWHGSNMLNTSWGWMS